MASLDIFNNDAFGVTNMIAAINEVPHVPTQLGASGMFGESGMTSPVAFIEMEGDTINLVPAAERGAPGVVRDKSKRKVIPFKAVHLPQMGGLNADEVLGVRAFGSETEVKTVQGMVNGELTSMRRDLDVTLEWQRMGAMKGQILDADGTTVLLDLYTAFGVTQQTMPMVFGTATTSIREKLVQAKRMAEAYLGGLMITGWKVWASAGFHDAFVKHADVKAAYDRYQEGAFLRADTRKGFEFAEVSLEEYRGKVGALDFIADGEAYLVPMGVGNMFDTKFAPADYVETVNTMGVPFYAKQELRKFGKGVDIEAQSNPLTINKRPRAVIKLTA
jgi:protein-disulfide isomerase-like protein with CxxC motif